MDGDMGFSVCSRFRPQRRLPLVPHQRSVSRTWLRLQASPGARPGVPPGPESASGLRQDSAPISGVGGVETDRD
jgi:hypothetical protein